MLLILIFPRDFILGIICYHSCQNLQFLESSVYVIVLCYLSDCFWFYFACIHFCFVWSVKLV